MLEKICLQTAGLRTTSTHTACRVASMALLQQIYVVYVGKDLPANRWTAHHLHTHSMPCRQYGLTPADLCCLCWKRFACKPLDCAPPPHTQHAVSPVWPYSSRSMLSMLEKICLQTAGLRTTSTHTACRVA